jgi:hypothetical protein
MLNGLVEQVSIVTHGPDRAQAGVAGTLGRLLAFLPEQEAGGLGHGVIDGRKPAAIHNGFD